MATEPRCIEIVDDEMADVLRRKTPAERLAMVNGMWCMARDLITAVVRADHPEWNEIEVQRETAKRLSHGAG